jgi:hypothetical protein
LHAKNLNRIEQSQHAKQEVSLDDLSDDVADKDACSKIVVNKHLLQDLFSLSVGSAILSSFSAPLSKTLLILGVERLDFELHVIGETSELGVGAFDKVLHPELKEVHAKRITHAHGPDVINHVRKELVADNTNIVLVFLRKHRPVSGVVLEEDIRGSRVGVERKFVTPNLSKKRLNFKLGKVFLRAISNGTSSGKAIAFGSAIRTIDTICSGRRLALLERNLTTVLSEPSSEALTFITNASTELLRWSALRA